MCMIVWVVVLRLWVRHYEFDCLDMVPCFWGGGSGKERERER
jgi:hypothetical protein